MEYDNWIVLDDKGISIRPINEFNIRKNSNSPNEFTLEFINLETSKKYKLVTQNLDNYEIREDLIFNITLKN